MVAKTGGRAYITTPDRVRVVDPRDGSWSSFDESVLAEAVPIPDENLRVDSVVVVVNLPLLEEVHRFSNARMDVEADLDRVLAHEIYGHAVPILLAGHMSGRCPDPLPEQPASESCAIQRENEVRAQLGLGRRTDDGLNSLAMVRSFRHRQVVKRSSMIPTRGDPLGGDRQGLPTPTAWR
jgi:hypothetical protein